MCSMSKNKADTGRRKGSTAAKVAIAVLGVGFVTGMTLVIGMDQVMKRIFVNEEWPDEEWTGDDLEGEELE